MNKNIGDRFQGEVNKDLILMRLVTVIFDTDWVFGGLSWWLRG